jgi:dienelactone hydrolase
VQVLQVQWRDLDPIDLYVVKPKGVEKPPVIVYLYGYPSTATAFTNESWLDRVTKGGYAAVGFVGALTDYRFRMRPMKQTYLTELSESLATTTHDVQMLLNYLGSRGDLDMSRVGLFGTGSGATVAILAAAADPRIKAIECFEPWGDWPKWAATSIEVNPQERADSMKPEFLAKVAPMDPVKWLPSLTKQQVQIQFIDTDDALAKDAKAAIEAAAPKNAQVIHFENRGHHFGAVSNGRFFDWLKAQLHAPVLAPQPQQASASAQNKGNKQ